MTFIAYRALGEWHRLAHALALDAPADVRAALEHHATIAPLRRGRLLTVGTDFGRHA